MDIENDYFDKDGLVDDMVGKVSILLILVTPSF